MTGDDYRYYATRARQEEEAAANAACDAARERHQELADAYRFRCSLLFGRNRPEYSMSEIDYATKTRQPIVSNRITALAASPPTA